MLKRLEHVLFSVRNASDLYNIERGKGYRPQRWQMAQELLTETVAPKHKGHGSITMATANVVDFHISIPSLSHFGPLKPANYSNKRCVYQ